MGLWQQLVKIRFLRIVLVWALGAAVVLSLVGPGQATETLYGINFTKEQLITIGTGTGTGTAVGPLDTSMLAFGLGSRSGRLYAYDQLADVIRELNPFTGGTVNTINIGSTLVGEGALAFRADGIGFLSASDGNTGTLYSFDITEPGSTLIGTLNVSMDGMDFYGGVLYGLSQSSDLVKSLYTINPTTGEVNLIGATGISDTNHLGGLAFRSDGTLFAAMNDSLYTLDTDTGAATLIGGG